MWICGVAHRLYEKAELPDRLVVIGDSACAFNPIFGQGMTVGVVEAVALGQKLSEAFSKVATAGVAVAGKRLALAGGLSSRLSASNDTEP